MRKLGGLAGLGLCLALAPHAADAAGFDGRWVADIPAQTGCNYISQMNVIVSGRDLSGQLQDPGETLRVSGQIGPDGSGTIIVGGKWSGALRFKDDHFDTNWGNGSCARHAEGVRDLDLAQSAAVAQERKQHQAAYADLLRRAQAGDKAIDYTVLRSESVYAKEWQFFNGRAMILLKQADVAVKGKDCVQGMDTLDQVLKFDFTIDAAHALRAECLTQAGKTDEARIESDIAKALVHSLMDSGKGDSEKTAYVVRTRSEEDDILANRHIQIKTRETQVRGADGRYFDVVHGVSVSTSNGVETNPRDIFFDMTSFVTGRTSRRAAQQVLAAELQ